MQPKELHEIAENIFDETLKWVKHEITAESMKSYQEAKHYRIEGIRQILRILVQHFPSSIPRSPARGTRGLGPAATGGPRET